ncbi:hypothetical protein [Hyphomicrobium sp. 99]|uniref:hypothetical protein n=1 Tax=Hyphomicrobium sp. 99 TaxID=1163419 RepID=UPI0009E20E85|nr:hypothetical protein [Hyphomicrobium sp. 99]
MRNKTTKPNDGKATGEDVCAGHALGFPMRAELGFLPIESITLDVFRCLCEVYTTGSAQPWEIAMKEAEEKLGTGEGPVLVARVTALLRALRSERKIGFSYLSVGCQHVSPDELAVSGLLKAARARDESALERGLKLALDGPQASVRTQFAVRALASLQLQHTTSGADIHADADSHELQKQTVQSLYLH